MRLKFARGSQVFCRRPRRRLRPKRFANFAAFRRAYSVDRKSKRDAYQPTAKSRAVAQTLKAPVRAQQRVRVAQRGRVDRRRVRAAPGAPARLWRRLLHGRAVPANRLPGLARVPHGRSWADAGYRHCVLGLGHGQRRHHQSSHALAFRRPSRQSRRSGSRNGVTTRGLLPSTGCTCGTRRTWPTLPTVRSPPDHRSA